MKYVQEGKVESGDVIGIRNEAPQGGPGMREMLASPPPSPARATPKTSPCLPTADSPARRGLLHRPRRPEAFAGGPIAALEDGDVITIDIDELELSVDLTDEEIEERASRTTSPNRTTTAACSGSTAATSAPRRTVRVTNPGVKWD